MQSIYTNVKIRIMLSYMYHDSWWSSEVIFKPNYMKTNICYQWFRYTAFWYITFQSSPNHHPKKQFTRAAQHTVSGLSTNYTHLARLAPHTCVCGVHKQKNRPDSDVALHNTFTCPNYWIGLRRYAQTSHFFIIKKFRNPKVLAHHLILPLWIIW